MLQGSPVEFVDSHIQLGVSLGTQFDGRAHLQCIRARGATKMHILLAELSSAGFPMHALLLAVRTRTLPSVAHAIELTVQVPFFEKQINATQASWFRKILGCKSAPRVVLMHELGTPDRLSAVACSRAIMVRQRARTDARYRTENEILILAESEPSSWPAAVVRKEQELRLPMLDFDGSNASAKQTKAKLRHHASTVVIPAMRVHEQTTWNSSAKISNAGRATVQLAMIGIGIRDAQAWSQLKLQGYFSHTASGPVAPCRFCAKDSLQALEHLFCAMWQCSSCSMFRRGWTTPLDALLEPT